MWVNVMINKVLVANRGEIAIRIMRACRELGIASVAVYSDADKDALFAKYADEAYYIGAAPAAESYLNIKKMIDVANQCGAQASTPATGSSPRTRTLLTLAKWKESSLSALQAGSLPSWETRLPPGARWSRAGVPVVPGYDEYITDYRTGKRYRRQNRLPCYY